MKESRRDDEAHAGPRSRKEMVAGGRFERPVSGCLSQVLFELRV